MLGRPHHFYSLLLRYHMDCMIGSIFTVAYITARDSSLKLTKRLLRTESLTRATLYDTRKY